MGDFSVNTAILALIAMFQFLAVLYTYKTNLLAKEIKHATNSMHDTMMAQQRIISHAEGVEQGRVAGEEKASSLAKGVLAEAAAAAKRVQTVKTQNVETQVVEKKTEKK